MPKARDQLFPEITGGMKILLNICLILCFVSWVFPAAAEPDCAHNSQLDKYRSVRFLPVEIKEIEGDRVFYVYRDDRQIVLGSFVLTEKSKVPKDFLKKHGGLWSVFYCDAHFSIYLAEKVEK